MQGHGEVGSIEQKQAVSRHGYLAFTPNSGQWANPADVRLTKEAAAWTGPPFPACWSWARERPVLGWPKMAGADRGGFLSSRILTLRPAASRLWPRPWPQRRAFREPTRGLVWVEMGASGWAHVRVCRGLEWWGLEPPQLGPLQSWSCPLGELRKEGVFRLLPWCGAGTGFSGETCSFLERWDPHLFSPPIDPLLRGQAREGAGAS